MTFWPEFLILLLLADTVHKIQFAVSLFFEMSKLNYLEEEDEVEETAPTQLKERKLVSILIFALLTHF